MILGCPNLPPTVVTCPTCFWQRRDSLDEYRLSVCVGDSVVRVSRREFHFQLCVFLRDVWMGEEVVAEQESVPMILERAAASHHVDVVRSRCLVAHGG